MKSLLHFSAILFLFIIGVSCSNSDDLPNPTQNPDLIATPAVATPAVTIPVVTIIPVVTTPAVTTPAVIVTFKADLKPRVGVTSAASGNATFQLNLTTKTFEISIDFTGLEPYLASIHEANGTFVLNYTPNIDSLYNDDYFPFTSPIQFHNTLSDAQIAELMDNHYYINLRTITYPNGEISGTLIKSGVD
jgi:hypothetical protein